MCKQKRVYVYIEGGALQHIVTEGVNEDLEFVLIDGDCEGDAKDGTQLRVREYGREDEYFISPVNTQDLDNLRYAGEGQLFQSASRYIGGKNEAR